jgi:PAS domain S-box-containing protein
MKHTCLLSSATILPICVCYYNDAGIIVEMNEELSQVTEHKDLIGARFESLLTMGSTYVYQTQVVPVLTRLGEVREIALDIDLSDGNMLPVIANFKTQFIESKQAGFVCTLMATPQRRELEMRLISMRRQVEESETRFRHIMEFGSDLIWEITADGTLNFISSACRKSLGLEPRELVGRSIYDLMHPVDVIAYRLALQSLTDLKQTIASSLEIRLQDTTGEWVWFQCQPTFLVKKEISHSKIGPSCFLDSLRDITATKSKELTSKAEQNFLDTIARLSGVGGWELNFIDNSLRWNSIAANIFGVDPDWNPTDLDTVADRFFDEQAATSLKHAIHSVLFSHAEILIQLPIVLPQGEVRWLEILGHPHSKNGDVIGVIGAVRDISETVKFTATLAEVALAAKHASEAKSQFLANMSHEIRTPLNGVLGVAAALIRTELNDRQRKMVEIITGSGRTLSALLNDILDFSKMEAGKLSLEPEVVSPRKLVAQVVGLFEINARAKGLGFEIDCDIPSSISIVADPLRIKQVLSNLIGNAVKFTTSGTVTVKARFETKSETQGELIFEISDTGPGFDDAVKERLFGRFEQADASTSRTFGGSGLGLSICKTLADMMEGQVSCESTLGVGSVFSFKACFEIQERVSESLFLRNTISVLPQDCVVLAVDDNEVNRDVLRLLLTENVGHLDFAVNGADAVNAYQTKHYDLILMDTQMPIMDGIVATQLIRADEIANERIRTPIITLSANAMDNQIAESRSAGADAYVSKPIDPEELLSTMSQLLKNSKYELARYSFDSHKKSPDSCD